MIHGSVHNRPRRGERQRQIETNSPRGPRERLPTARVAHAKDKQQPVWPTRRQATAHVAHAKGRQQPAWPTRKTSSSPCGPRKRGRKGRKREQEQTKGDENAMQSKKIRRCLPQCNLNVLNSSDLVSSDTHCSPYKSRFGKANCRQLYCASEPPMRPQEQSRLHPGAARTWRFPQGQAYRRLLEP